MGRGVLVERRPEVTSSDEYLAWYRQEYEGILGTMEEEIPDAYVELNEMEKRLKTANEHLQARARQIEVLRVQRKRSQDQVRVLEAQVDALSRTRAVGASSSSAPPPSVVSERELELTRELDAARSELVATRMELGEARGKASRAEDEPDRLRSMMASREEEFTTLGRERKSLQMRVSELEASAGVLGGLMGDLLRSLQAAGDRDREALRSSEDRLRAAEARSRELEERLRHVFEGGWNADLDLLPLKPEHYISASLATGATFSHASRPSASRSRGIYARAASSVRDTPTAPDAPEVPKELKSWKDGTDGNRGGSKWGAARLQSISSARASFGTYARSRKCRFTYATLRFCHRGSVVFASKKEIENMDTLFEAQFSPLAESGSLLSKCGKCTRYMKYISSRPSRLFCVTCEEVYNLPQNGTVKLYKELACPLDNFELLLFSMAGPDGKSFPLCPYCYNSPPFEGIDALFGALDLKSSSGKPGKGGGMPCFLCPHPTCRHSLIAQGVCACPECNGTLVLDPVSAPKWRLYCNMCNCMVLLPHGAHRISTTRDRCPECESTIIEVDFNKKTTPLKDGATLHVGCILCDELLHSLVEMKHGKSFFRRGDGRVRGRGRGRGRGGRRGRGSGKYEDPKMSFRDF
ncbi:hypothetical protein QJS10_CPB04g01429 [Acorus calamus]|uniref:DNA topoisomerase n=1 Tax=Acorus calamus TaxID=4465 RepID=A0AAV9F2H2_ACOCL|nr:hypothetical protein QJS10_CPB04g01429 [Acorus calamus]